MYVPRRVVVRPYGEPHTLKPLRAHI
jgi:hypothetical protein